MKGSICFCTAFVFHIGQYLQKWKEDTKKKLDVSIFSCEKKALEGTKTKVIKRVITKSQQESGNATYSISLSYGIHSKKTWQTKSIIQGTLAGLIIQWTLIWQPSCPCDGLFSAAAAEHRPLMKFLSLSLLLPLPINLSISHILYIPPPALLPFLSLSLTCSLKQQNIHH